MIADSFYSPPAKQTDKSSEQVNFDYEVLLSDIVLRNDEQLTFKHLIEYILSGGYSPIKMTGVLVGNFEKNP